MWPVDSWHFCPSSIISGLVKLWTTGSSLIMWFVSGGNGLIVCETAMSTLNLISSSSLLPAVVDSPVLEFVWLVSIEPVPMVSTWSCLLSTKTQSVSVSAESEEDSMRSIMGYSLRSLDLLASGLGSSLETRSVDSSMDLESNIVGLLDSFNGASTVAISSGILKARSMTGSGSTGLDTSGLLDFLLVSSLKGVWRSSMFSKLVCKCWCQLAL